MPDDFRLQCSFFDHPKTVKLARRLGDPAVLCLLRLFAFCAKNEDRMRGDLSGLDDEDLEIAAGWAGEHGVFARTLREVKFLDGDRIRDWETHQPWAANFKKRSTAAKIANLVRWHKRGQHRDEPHPDCRLCADGVRSGSDSDALRTKPDARRTKADSPDPDPDPDPVTNSITNSNISARSPNGPSPEIEIPLVTKDGSFAVYADDVREFAEAYPGIDVLAELRKARSWCLNNPRQRKTARGVRRFLNSWLDRAQNRARAPSGYARPSVVDATRDAVELMQAHRAGRQG